MQRNRAGSVRRPKAGRATAGQGTVYQSTYDGYWKTELTIHGTTIKRSSRTEDEAREKLAELLRQRDEGLEMGSDQQTLGTYLASWLRDVKGPSVRPRTYLTYRTCLEHVRSELGTVRLGVLKTRQLTALYASLYRNGYAPASLSLLHRTVKAALAHAVDSRLITHNPADAAVVPRNPRKRMEIFTSDEIARIVEHSRGTRWCALWVLMASTGMRVGEATALTWSDVRDGVVHIQRTVTVDMERKHVLAEVKTPRSRRSIHLPAAAVSALAAHRTLQIEERLAATRWTDLDLIFPNRHGGVVHPSAVREVWVAMLDALDLRQLRIHDLRHTAASLLLQRGTHPKVVQEMLGHSSISITLDRYSHVVPAMHREAAETMDSVLGRLEFGSQTPKITPEVEDATS